MKRIIYVNIVISCLLLTLFSCEPDNYDGPTSQIHGSIKDASTGELVETELINGNVIRTYEQGFEVEQRRNWFVKNSGEYRNNLVFAGEYRYEMFECNFYPIEGMFTLSGGENNIDFEVIPYIRIVNPSIEKVGDEIIATFSLEAGGPEVALKEIRLFAFSDVYVGNFTRFDLKSSNDRIQFNPAVAVDNSTYTLTIDLSANENFFPYAKNYYFRIGALAAVNGVVNSGAVKFNYAPYEVITLNQ
ncbi:DUF3823 domain-containing protein [Marinilabilia rubra]|uniref:DUF3823 domain-containing protein n=1 Tax=Marinilabilia rubra TaxID=2162893 RepID=A0A2U2B7A4_9BACT|nr:DUF3823 domain-containing protein [Marinilabilia rubra]PWD98959.1 hypothetical protein DDZ16_13260 [Marinilabilia rubra]